MNIYLKFNWHALRKTIVAEQMQKLKIPYTLVGTGELVLKNEISEDQRKQLKLALGRYGIEILEDHGTSLVQRIKDAIIEMVRDERARRYKLSTYLSEKLNYSYTHLSNIFPEETHTSIERFVILQKIDYAKDLMIERNLTITETSHELGYSSPAHFSSQFKKATGLTPSAFQRIIEDRK